jgi:uncharacterized protein
MWTASTHNGSCGHKKGGHMTVFNGRILDAHTHLSGSESGENAEDILQCLDAAGVEKAFIFAPLVNVKTWQLTDQHLQDVRDHNDYCAHLCSAESERLLGFCVLNPSHEIGNGSLHRAVDSMIEEVRRCYHELGLRGVKMVPTNWYPNDPQLVRLYREIASLGMYTVFHSGIFLDGFEGSYCRPTYFEAVHQAPGFRGHLAHVSWPWVDECLAVLNMETMMLGKEAEKWDLIADLSFGSPDDWQLDTWQKAITTVPPEMLVYGSDVFWPCTADLYCEQYLQPQLGLFETAATLGHVATEGSAKRKQLRSQIFYDNVWNHWQRAVREPQQPRPADRPIVTPNAKRQDARH